MRLKRVPEAVLKTLIEANGICDSSESRNDDSPAKVRSSITKFSYDSIKEMIKKQFSNTPSQRTL